MKEVVVSSELAGLVRESVESDEVGKVEMGALLNDVDCVWRTVEAVVEVDAEFVERAVESGQVDEVEVECSLDDAVD